MDSRNERKEKHLQRKKRARTLAKSITIESIQAFYFNALFLNNNCFANFNKEEKGKSKKKTHKFERIHTENNVIRNLCCKIKDEKENYEKY